ncbi:MAG TPA: tripartite tricarboxylate transporter substrate binding protein [Burkholderiales bacterium]|nr:tripartite tricarboxylate transporter substrate binding protein [Burkholderiales bacterium]
MHGALRGLLAAVAALWMGAAVAQQAYPTKPIRFIVPYEKGSAGDVIARAMEPVLSERLRQPVLVENRPGAGGNVGLDGVAKSAPDGYTIGLGTAGSLAANVSLYPKMTFNPEKDLEAVSSVAYIPFMLVAPAKLPANNLEEVLALARAKPGELLIGFGGSGSAMHLSVELFKLMAKVQLVNVPYKNSAAAAQDAAAGRLSLALVDVASAMPDAKAGRLKPIAVTTATRIPSAPDVPTISEAGVPGYDATGWFGIVAPAKTPASIVLRLNGEIESALKRAEVRDRLIGAGAEPAHGTPAQLSQLIRTEIPKWAEVVKASGARPD